MFNYLLILFISLCSAGYAAPKLLTPEPLAGNQVWLDPLVKQSNKACGIQVWFDQQFLGSGDSYSKRAKQLDQIGRQKLRLDVEHTLKHLSDKSYAKVDKQMAALQKNGAITQLNRHWIINGFSCVASPEAVAKIAKLPGVKKIFLKRIKPSDRATPPAAEFEPPNKTPFDPHKSLPAWYTKGLLADKVWKELKVTGKGITNVVIDRNFVMIPSVKNALYTNPKETRANQKDDDKNGYVDDVYGYNFTAHSNRVSFPQITAKQKNRCHGTACANVICGSPTEFNGKSVVFGIAPGSRWAAVIGRDNMEDVLEWCIEQGLDTVSLSASLGARNNSRSKLRKAIEHASFCGIFFVSGAGNDGSSDDKRPQITAPADIPAVFAASGVQRNLGKTSFSSRGPVFWNNEHYRDGKVMKPDFCCFNQNLPYINDLDQVKVAGLNGNSFAGPMLCGVIALVVSADPEITPWQLRSILSSTCTDLAAPGVDEETGHGLVNAFRAVKEALRRKALGEGVDASKFTGREDSDELDKTAAAAIRSSLKISALMPKGQAAKAGARKGDVIKSYNGEVVSSQRSLSSAFRRARENGRATVELRVERKQQLLTFKVAVKPLGMKTEQVSSQSVFGE